MWKQVIPKWISLKIEACKASRLRMFTTVGQLCAFVVALTLFSFGVATANFAQMMVGSLFVWIASVCYCLADMKSRILLLAFDVVVFVFLMCRPLIDIARGFTRWHYYAGPSVFFAIVSVTVSVLSLYFGAIACEMLLREKGDNGLKNCGIVSHSHDVTSIRRLAFLAYLFCSAFYLIREMDALVFMQGRQYTDYYTKYSSSYPSFVYTISEMMPYALCMYLATFPKKKQAFIILALYVVLAVPQLIIGIRNPIVLNLIFAFLYYCLRDIIGDEEKWFGRFEKCCLVIGVPVVAFALSIYNYLRDGMEVANTGFFAIIEDLFYKQGVSFDVLCMGHNAIPMLPGGGKCYTFGPFIDNFMRGAFGQILFGTIPFPSGNSAIRAIEGNSFAHSMSYAAHPDYLEGSGWGSSYILETFADWGWLGIVGYSIVLGAFLIWFLRGMRGNWFVRTVLLISLTQMLFVPRAEAMGWWSFVTRIHFWFVLFACVVGSKIEQKLGVFSVLDRVLKRSGKL